MSGGNFLVEGPEDLTQELEFDKFMDEILVTESDKERTEEENIDDNPVRKMLKETTERPAGRTRFVRK